MQFYDRPTSADCGVGIVVARQSLPNVARTPPPSSLTSISTTTTSGRTLILGRRRHTILTIIPMIRPVIRVHAGRQGTGLWRNGIRHTRRAQQAVMGQLVRRTCGRAKWPCQVADRSGQKTARTTHHDHRAATGFALCRSSDYDRDSILPYLYGISVSGEEKL